MKINNIYRAPHNKTTWSWSLDIAWGFTLLTFAVGFWNLGVWETVAYCFAVATNIFAIVFVIARFFGYMKTEITKGKLFDSICKNISYAAAMFFAWPTSWVGPVFVIALAINLCFLKIKSPKNSSTSFRKINQ